MIAKPIEKKYLSIHYLYYKQRLIIKRSMLMKKINFVLTFLLVWLTGATAMADNVLMKNYLETFENEFAETRDPPSRLLRDGDVMLRASRKTRESIFT